MIQLFNFLVEGSLLLIVFALSYYYLFQKDNQLNFRRFLMLGFLLLTLAIPFMDFSLTLNEENTGQVGALFQESVNTAQSYVIPEITINPQQGFDTGAETDYLFITLMVVYFGGIALILGRLLRQIAKIFSLSRDKRFARDTFKGYTLIKTHGILPTFSFGRVIFFDDDKGLTESEQNQILDHEAHHIEEYHSFDIILIEIIAAFFWFNPAVWYLRREIKIVHEFLADKEVIKNYSSEAYSSLLARVTLSKAGITLGHHFNKSETLKRITMLGQISTKPSKWKAFVMLPLIVGLSLVFSCNEEIIADLTQMNETLSQAPVPESLKTDFNRYQTKFPEAQILYAEVAEDNEDALFRLKKVDGNTILQSTKFEERGTIGLIFMNSSYISNLKQPADSTKETFTIVDNPAMPEGGYAQFYKFIAENMVYPPEARELGIEGRVFIQFVVNEYGFLVEVKPIKGIGGGCDEEAKRVIDLALPWEPASQEGKLVRQRIVLPINFMLKGSNSDNKVDKFLNTNTSVVPKPDHLREFLDHLGENFEVPSALFDAGKTQIKAQVTIKVDKKGEFSGIAISLREMGFRGLGELISQNVKEAIEKSGITWEPAKKEGEPVEGSFKIPYWITVDSINRVHVINKIYTKN